MLCFLAKASLSASCNYHPATPVYNWQMLINIANISWLLGWWCALVLIGAAGCVIGRYAEYAVGKGLVMSYSKMLGFVGHWVAG